VTGSRTVTGTGPAPGWSGPWRSEAPSVHLNAQLVSADDGYVVMSNGAEFDSGLIVWIAGSASNSTVHNHTDFPVDDRVFSSYGPAFGWAQRRT